VNDTLDRFVRKALTQGESRDRIREALRAAGWPEDEITDALAAFADTPFSVPVPRRRPYLDAREAFVYLVLFMTLYTSAIGLGVLVFEVIENAFPDALESWWAINASRSAIRWATASLVIAFPVYLLLSRSSLRALARDPEKRQSRIRKWLTYLTLFVAAAVILTDLITLVFNVLEGELTLRFVLKVVAAAIIAGAVFAFYLWDLRRDEVEVASVRPASPKRLRLFAAGATLAVVLAIGAGLVVAGSPQSARQQRLDAERVDHLRQLSSAIDSYWHRHGRLPDALEALTRERGLYLTALEDPESGAPYGYQPQGETSYELCASFALTSEETDLSRLPSDSQAWLHGTGETCFPLEVVTARAPASEGR
jgi:hypothetical protein